MHLDYSAHAAFDTCPAYWYEKYVHRRSRRWPKAQRDDALCLGSLVHEGLRVWQQSHTVEIPASIQEECTPSRECLALSEELVWGYTQKYPEELWPLIVCEEPVMFPLQKAEAAGYSGIGHFHEGVADLTGLAKIDAYFYVPEPTEIDSGFGLTYTLSRGWWIHEYKTKSPYVSLPLYMQGWEMGMQASYQLTALTNLMASNPGGFGDPTVGGILINVLEKPRRHIPQRKCRACNESYEFATWIPTETGMYGCPVCGTPQTLTKLKENPTQIPPAYYRICVTRTREELARARDEMIMMGQRMLAMEAGGKLSEPWRKSSCINFQWKKACEYFSACKDGLDTRQDDYSFFSPPDYRGLVTIGEV